MNKILFQITSKINIWLDALCMWIVDDGKRYNEYHTIFHIIDNLATKIYNFGYNRYIK